MAYSKMLARRLKEKRMTAKTSETGAQTAEIADVHPGRYPKHADPAKGQVYGGICNTTRCNNGRAVWFNRGTYGLYCPTCAHGQNGNDPVPISVPVSAKPTLAEMAQMQADMMQQMRGLRG